MRFAFSLCSNIRALASTLLTPLGGSFGTFWGSSFDADLEVVATALGCVLRTDESISISKL